VWSEGRANNGEMLLEGSETFYYPNGRVQWSLNYHLGRKTGVELLLRENGTKKWEKSYGPNDTWTWGVFDEAGQKTAESKWTGKTLVDVKFY
jgi:antitoxin component YwqK of YwqJK toxin-antitoxin module